MELVRKWFGDFKRCAALLVGLALLKGIVFLGLVSAHVTKPFVGANAEVTFFPVAERLLNEHRFNGEDSRQDSRTPPGYPLLIAAVEALHLPAVPTVIVMLQILADAATSICLLWFGALLSNVIAGGIAGLAWSLYPPAIVMSTWMTQEPIFTTMLAASLAMVVATLLTKKSTLVTSLGAGLLMGLATMIRATPLLIPVVLIPGWFVKRKLADGLVFVCGMLLFVVPWTIRNAIVLHDRIPVAIGTGSVFLYGTDEDQVHRPETKETFVGAMAEEGTRHGIYKPYPEYESAIDHWLFSLGMMRYQERWHTRPLSFIGLYMNKLLRLWYATDSATPKAQLLLGFCSILVVPLGLWQIWRWRKINQVFFLTIGGVMVYFIGMHTVLLPLIRYMLPIYPLLILACSHWLCNVLSLSPSRSSAMDGLPSGAPQPVRAL